MLTHIHFVDLPVTDQQRALEFYTTKLGFETHTDAPYEGDRRWIMLKIPGAQTLVHFSPRADQEPAEIPALPLISDQIDADHTRLVAAGVECLAAPQPAPWNSTVQYFLCRDSENNLLLIQSSPKE